MEQLVFTIHILNFRFSLPKLLSPQSPNLETCSGTA